MLISLSGRDRKKVDVLLRIQTKFSDELKNKSSPQYQELEIKVKIKVSVSFYDYFHFEVILLLQFFLHKIIYQFWPPPTTPNELLHSSSFFVHRAFCTHFDKNRSHCFRLFGHGIFSRYVDGWLEEFCMKPRFFIYLNPIPICVISSVNKHVYFTG